MLTPKDTNVMTKDHFIGYVKRNFGGEWLRAVRGLPTSPFLGVGLEAVRMLCFATFSFWTCQIQRGRGRRRCRVWSKEPKFPSYFLIFSSYFLLLPSLSTFAPYQPLLVVETKMRWSRQISHHSFTPLRAFRRRTETPESISKTKISVPFSSRGRK